MNSFTFYVFIICSDFFLKFELPDLCSFLPFFEVLKGKEIIRQKKLFQGIFTNHIPNLSKKSNP
jgi:hypothetical protein